MVFNCEVCGYKTTTEGGMKLHHKVAHSERPEVESAPVKIIISQPKKPKKTSDTLASTELYIKEKKERYEAMKKKWPKKATGVATEEKISKATLVKVFPKETDVFVNGKLPAVPLHPKLESSYAVSVKEMKNDWLSITLTGKKTKITWKEGPFPKQYRVTIPSLQTK
jgi:hypothetical protein